MSSRVQKGGTVFRPVAKSRTRATNPSRQPSVLVEQPNNEIANEANFTQDYPKSSSASSLQTVSSPFDDSDDVTIITVNSELSAISEEPVVASQHSETPSIQWSTMIGIPIRPPQSTPIVLAAPTRNSIAPQSHISALSNNFNGPTSSLVAIELTPSIGKQVEKESAFTAKNIQNESTHVSAVANSSTGTGDKQIPSTSTGAPDAPVNTQTKIKKRRKSSDEQSKKQKRRRSEQKNGGNNENDEGSSPTPFKPHSRASSSAPRSRKRAPSPPPYDPEADPGEEIDPTTVTMASLCEDTGQGRVSSKAAEILSNHAAWKQRNREKRAKMKQLMEAKKYGREDDDRELEEGGTPGEESNPSVITNPSTAPAEETEAAGFDYSQNLSTSRYNVQVRIGPNGETVIDEESLLVDRAENDGTENYTHIIESDHTKFVNSGTYAKRYRGSRWSAEETELFYDALAQYGENYELIACVLPGRDRKACKNKFKVEDKRNHSRINYCLENRIPVDMKTLSRMTGKDFSGPVPEIRVPVPPLPTPPTSDTNGDAYNVSEEDAPSHRVKKRSRSKSTARDDGAIVLGDIADFEN